MDKFGLRGNDKIVLQYIADKNTLDYTFPVTPPFVRFGWAINDREYDTLKYGPITIPGNLGARRLSFSSFFPDKHYDFLVTGSKAKLLSGTVGQFIKYDTLADINIIEKYRGIDPYTKLQKNKAPIRIIIDALEIDMLARIPSFDVEKRSVDMDFDIVFVEFKTPVLEQVL